MAAAFLLSTLVQYNDPDPFRWMAFYGAACVACVLAAARPQSLAWRVPAVIGLVAAAWAATIAPRVIGRVALPQLFASWEMKSPLVEEAREMGGLLIVAAWMAVLVVARRVARRPGAINRPA